MDGYILIGEIEVSVSAKISLKKRVTSWVSAGEEMLISVLPKGR